MNEPVPRRPRFTLLQLLAVVTAISIALGVSVPLVRRWQEEGQQSQCSNNLRVFALAVHMYHDVDNELPPLATDPDHWTWLLLTQPFYDSRSIYAHLQKDKPASDAANLPLIRRTQQYRVNMNPWLCPARRDDGKRETGTYAGVQATDYVAVSSSNSLKWSADGDGMIVYRRAVETRATNPAMPPGSMRVRSATTFGSVTDGFANTFMLGEKHMRPDWLGGQYDEPALVAFEDQNTIRVATDQLGGKPLAGSREDDDPWKFGSWHDGVTLFALGDASVKPIANHTDPSVLRSLSCRNDGVQVELP